LSQILYFIIELFERCKRGIDGKGRERCERISVTCDRKGKIDNTQAHIWKEWILIISPYIYTHI
jgi:hypothetical protein